jgi:Phosphotransferase enzyme family
VNALVAEQTELLGQVRKCFSPDCIIESIEQFKGGARKQVFFLKLNDPNTECALYIWNDETHYFSEREEAGFEEGQTDTEAPELFIQNTRFLQDLGFNVPRLLYAGILNDGQHFAFVEKIDSSNFRTFATTASPAAVQTVLEQIRAQLAKLHAITRAYPGPLTAEASTQSQLPADKILARALLEIKATAETHPQIAEHKERVTSKLQSLRAQLEPRATYCLIHGELAKEHTLVRQADQTVCFVDIEGLHFFDLEFEYSFLRMVYSAEEYAQLARTDLDPARMAFYKFAMHVSLVYAGSRFMMRGFHDQAFAEHLFTHHFAQILKSLDA